MTHAHRRLFCDRDLADMPAILSRFRRICFAGSCLHTDAFIRRSVRANRA